MVDNESQEMYLETILKIKKRKGSVRAYRIYALFLLVQMILVYPAKCFKIKLIRNILFLVNCK